MKAYSAGAIMRALKLNAGTYSDKKEKAAYVQAGNKRLAIGILKGRPYANVVNKGKISGGYVDQIPEFIRSTLKKKK